MSMVGAALPFLAETLLLLSYLTTQMLYLRIVAVSSAICFISAALYAGLDSPGMTASFIFSFLSLLINALNIFRLLYTRMPAPIPSEYQEAYEKIFAHLTPREFLILLRFAESDTFSDEIVIEEGSKADVFLVLKGQLKIVQQNKTVATIDAPNMIGEISYLTSQNAMATVQALGDVTALSWTHASLHKLEKKYEHIYLKFHSTLLSETRNKLIKQNVVAFD